MYFVDVDISPKLGAEEEIASVPTVLYYKEGEAQEQLKPTGTKPFIEKVNSL